MESYLISYKFEGRDIGFYLYKSKLDAFEGNGREIARIGEASFSPSPYYTSESRCYVCIPADEYLLSQEEERWLAKKHLTLKDFNTSKRDAVCVIISDYYQELCEAAANTLKEKGFEYSTTFDIDGSDWLDYVHEEHWKLARNQIGELSKHFTVIHVPDDLV